MWSVEHLNCMKYCWILLGLWAINSTLGPLLNFLRPESTWRCCGHWWSQGIDFSCSTPDSILYTWSSSYLTATPCATHPSTWDRLTPCTIFPIRRVVVCSVFDAGVILHFQHMPRSAYSGHPRLHQVSRVQRYSKYSNEYRDIKRSISPFHVGWKDMVGTCWAKIILEKSRGSRGD